MRHLPDRPEAAVHWREIQCSYVRRQLQGLDDSKKRPQGGTVSAINQDRDPSPQEGTPMWHSGIDQHKRDPVTATYGLDGPRAIQLRAANTPLTLSQNVA